MGDGSSILTSVDGKNWYYHTPFSAQVISSITSNGEIFVIVTHSGNIYTSPDGEKWQLIYQQSNALISVKYCGGIFVAVGANGTILTSNDGIVWKKANSNTTNRLLKISFGNGLVMVAGDKGTLLTSKDGSVWTAQRSGVTESITMLLHSQDKFFFTANGSAAVYESTNGTHWQSKSLPGGYSAFVSGYYLGNKTIILGGTDSHLVESKDDGNTWQDTTSRLPKRRDGYVPSLLSMDYVNPADKLVRYDYYYYSRYYDRGIKLSPEQLKTVDVLIFHGTPDPNKKGDFLINDPNDLRKFNTQYNYLMNLKQTSHLKFKLILGLGDLDNLNTNNIGHYILELQHILTWYKFSGVDLDWESSVGVNQYTAVVKAISAILKNNDIFTIGIGWYDDSSQNYFKKAKAVKDYITNVTMQYYGSGTMNSEPASAMMDSANNLSEYTGISKRKIMVGLPIYGGSTNGKVDTSYAGLIEKGANCWDNQFGDYAYTGVVLANEKLQALSGANYGGYFNFEMSLDMPYDNKCSIIYAEDNFLSTN